MFTGLIVERGSLIEDPAPSGQGGVRLTIGLSPDLAARLAIGDSLAVSGVCLTVIEKGADRVGVELSPETLSRTTLSGLNQGDAVNLEPALRMGDALGGHWVQGHVDGAARVMDRRDLTDHRVLAFSIPPDLAPFLVEKGSVTVDGVSLTVVEVTPAGGDRPATFTVSLIPTTLDLTTLGRRNPGSLVNIEVDVLAKYVEKLHAGTTDPNGRDR
jgi:riboflavin synthase